MVGTYVNVICSSRAETFKSIVKILTNRKLQKEEQTNRPNTPPTRPPPPFKGHNVSSEVENAFKDD